MQGMGFEWGRIRKLHAPLPPDSLIEECVGGAGKGAGQAVRHGQTRGAGRPDDLDGADGGLEMVGDAASEVVATGPGMSLYIGRAEHGVDHPRGSQGAFAPLGRL